MHPHPSSQHSSKSTNRTPEMKLVGCLLVGSILYIFLYPPHLAQSLSCQLLPTLISRGIVIQSPPTNMGFSTSLLNNLPTLSTSPSLTCHTNSSWHCINNQSLSCNC